MKYAEIIIAISNKQLDKGFHYIIPDRMKDILEIGIRVLVPFGGGNKNIEGYVVGFANEIDFDSSKAKEIVQIVDAYPLFDKDLLILAQWMQEKYYTTLYACLQTLMPKGIKLRSEYVAYINENSSTQSITKKQKEIINYIATHFGVSENELKEVFGNTVNNTLKLLREKNRLI